MKKTLMVVVSFVLVVLLVTGCSNKESKLVCKQQQSGVDIVFNVGFKGNVLKSMDFNYDMDLSSYNDAQIDAIRNQDFCTVVKNSMSQYANAFTNCTKDINENKHLIVESKLDVNKITKNELEKLQSPKKTKEALEAVGYSCEIK